MDITISQATIHDLGHVAPLFDAYRQFYRQPSNIELARTFLQQRIERHESVIFIAFDHDRRALGFMQLYPSFSSGRAAPIYILNDLFVAPAARRKGIGTLLLKKAEELGRAAGAVRLRLSTELTNASAQALYESLGWKRETAFCDYNLDLTT